MNHIKTSLICLFVLVCTQAFALQNNQTDTKATDQAIARDSIVRTMQEEIKASMEQLAAKEVPAYYMSLRLNDKHQIAITSEYGVASTRNERTCNLTPQVRVGSPETDNFKYESQSWNETHYEIDSYPVPYSGNTIAALKQGIWQKTMERYDIALGNYDSAISKMKTNADNEDKAPCFVFPPVERYYENEPDGAYHSIDIKSWEERLNCISNVFKGCEHIQQAKADLSYELERTYIVTSHGSVVVQNRKAARIMIQASVKADDGMSCPLYKDWFAFSINDLPDDSVMIAAAKDMIGRLMALREAPVADPYAGPAIMSGSASGVFFHEIFGHRLEAHRMKSGGQTFKRMVGERILPEDFQVYDDPTMASFSGNDLNGYYRYDDEAVKAERVNCVENGVLKNFLLGSTPIDGFPRSNGHGRAYEGYDAVSRQANLIIQSSRPRSEEELRKMLLDAIKKEGKEYGYYFRTATSGMTYTGEGKSINSFGVDPVEVYRVYADGRDDQLVRGVTMIGTPLAMFSGIAAGGADPVIFTGMCGAESGWVPVTAIAPSIFVSKIETQRSSTRHTLPQVLKRPDCESMNGSEEQIIFKAMEDEMARSKAGLTAKGSSGPLFIDYQLLESNSIDIVSSLGGIVSSYYNPKSFVVKANVLIGDSLLVSPSTQNLTQLGNKADYYAIRQTLWQTSDAIYKRAISGYSKKLNMLKNKPKPETEATKREIFDIPAGEHISESIVNTSIDRKSLEDLCNELSAVYMDYPELYNTNVHIKVEYTDAYRLNSDGLKLRLPYKNQLIETSACSLVSNGAEIDEYYTIPFDLQNYNIEDLKNSVREFADAIMLKSKADITDDFYIGPVLLERNTIPYYFSKIVSNYGIARNTWDYESLRYGGTLRSLVGGMLLGKRFLDTKIGIHIYSDMKSYKGNNLNGTYNLDYDGIRPESDFTFVENGILRNLICGRMAASGASKASGHSQIPLSYSVESKPAVRILHVRMNEARPYSKVKEQLFSEARKAGLDYVYTIGSTSNDCFILKRMDIRTGKETPIKEASMPNITRKELMHVVSASKEENIWLRNSNETIIAPEAMLLESVEMNIKKPAKAPQQHLINPTLRK
ncbi:MAG: metallopeptidase TldD-related protein [Bacteroidales bacterium]|nr:metallopeptidase TldD-related protein [Bacteroidales bacterium]